MCQFLLFLHTMSHFLTLFLKNRVGILSTFYHGYIHRSCATALVSLIQPRLNIYFLLVPNSKGGRSRRGMQSMFILKLVLPLCSNQNWVATKSTLTSSLTTFWEFSTTCIGVISVEESLQIFAVVLATTISFAPSFPRLGAPSS